MATKPTDFAGRVQLDNALIAPLALVPIARSHIALSFKALASFEALTEDVEEVIFV